MAAAALRPAILRRIRLSPSPAAAAGVGASQPHALARWLARPMSSHDAHLTRDEVVDRLVDVLKSHPKVDPAKVRDRHPSSHAAESAATSEPPNTRRRGWCVAGEPRGALREGSGAGQPGHGGGGDGDRGGVQARDPRPGGRQDRLAPARHRVRRQPPHGRLTAPPPR
uniref:Acyl carrier protein n=1 Tax=Oryza brachyantha TaxID=4533 RepID=J3MJH1_ORYBR